jgi:hypothetical protein
VEEFLLDNIQLAAVVHCEHTLPFSYHYYPGILHRVEEEPSEETQNEDQEVDKFQNED